MFYGCWRRIIPLKQSCKSHLKLQQKNTTEDYVESTYHTVLVGAPFYLAIKINEIYITLIAGIITSTAAVNNQILSSVKNKAVNLWLFEGRLLLKAKSPHRSSWKSTYKVTLKQHLFPIADILSLECRLQHENASVQKSFGTKHEFYVKMWNFRPTKLKLRLKV